MLNQYKDSKLDVRQRLREILQQCALLGLTRTKFFEHAAFYGGTALRILYQLDRFSEDLDFSLLLPDKHFDLTPFLLGLERELESMGFDLKVEVKKKVKESEILSAFIKGNTKILVLSLTNRQEKNIQNNEVLKIKFEIDINPPLGFDVEPKLILNPVPFYVLSYALPDLFAGKMHAMLCRGWQKRVKGRDWYDFIWFLQNNVPVHLAHMEARIKQSGHFDKKKSLTEDILKKLLKKRVDEIDWKEAVKDVEPFVCDVSHLHLWGNDFFEDLVSKIQFI